MMKNMIIKAQMTKMGMVDKLRSKMLRKKDGGKEILTELGLIIVGVVLLVLFRTQIVTLVGDIITKVGEQIKALF